MKGRTRNNDHEICGWEIESELMKYTQIFTPSPKKKNAILPQLSVRRHLPSLKPCLTLQKQTKQPSINNKNASKRLKSQSFDSYHPLPPLTSQERSPIRLFPSLPMLFSAQLNDINSTEPSQPRQVMQPFHKRFVKYHEMEESFNFKIIQKKLGMDKQANNRKEEENNPEIIMTKRQSKQTLKLSTIEIVSKQIKSPSKMIKPIPSISEGKEIVSVKKGKGKILSKLKVNDEDNAIDGELKQAKMLKLPTKNEAQFSDNTIFTKHSPSNTCLQAQPHRFRLIIKPQ